MRALQYEGTPLENAQSFKEQGNDMVKVKRWKDGQEFYSKALLILQKSRLDRRGTQPADVGSEQESLKEAQLEEVCLVNRALCNLELSELKLHIWSSSSTIADVKKRITDQRPLTVQWPCAIIPKMSRLSTVPRRPS